MTTEMIFQGLGIITLAIATYWPEIYRGIKKIFRNKYLTD